MLKINERDNEGCTALICAAETGREDIMRALIQKGADLNVRNKVGMTAMNVAAEKGFIECVRVLLIAGADMNLDSEHYYHSSPDEDPFEMGGKIAAAIMAPKTPIESAACNGHTDIVKLLFSSGAYTDYATLSYVVRLEKFLANRKEIIELLLEHGVPAATETHPMAAYEEACKNEMLKDDAEILKLLGGTVPDTSKEQKEKADSSVMQQNMVDAINSKDVEQLKKLIDEGADINAVNKDGETALHLATRVAQSSSVVQMLLDAGADVNAKNNNGSTALMLAADYSGNETVKVLLDAGADVNAKDNDGYTALMCAARNYSDNETVKVLINAGADVNAYDAGRGAIRLSNGTWCRCRERTALMHAARYSDSETVKELLNAGADVNKSSAAGYTALMLALSNTYKKNRLDIVKTLVDAGADTKITCKCEVTAMFGKKKEKDVTPYEYALSELGKDDPVTQYLKQFNKK